MIRVITLIYLSIYFIILIIYFAGIVDRVRNDPTQKNEHFDKRLKRLANVHAQLLNHALKSYPNLERLVYSTCSANPEENEAVVDEALSVNGKFKLLNSTKMLKGWTNKGAPGYDCSEMCLNAVPNIDCTNGFFIAIFVRRDFDETESKVEEEGDDEEVEEDEKEKEKKKEEDEEKEEEKIEKEDVKQKQKKNKKKEKRADTVIEKEEENPKKKQKKSKKRVKEESNERMILESKEPKIDSDKNTLQTKSIKDNANTPVKKSKNVKRRERRLKLEEAKGITKKIKKPKKVKTEELKSLS